jgi:hypothetical protein
MFDLQHPDSTRKDILPLFLHDKQDALISFGDGESKWHYSLAISCEAMAMAIQQAYPPFFELPVEVKIKFAISIGLGHPQAFLLVLGGNNLERFQFEIQNKLGYTLLDTIAFNLACMISGMQELVDAWFSLLSRVILLNVDLHSGNESRRGFLSEVFYYYEYNTFQKIYRVLSIGGS